MNIIDSKIPGLAISRPDIVKVIMSYQTFQVLDMIGYKFMELCNENK